MPMASASSQGSDPPRPPTASQPPTGATAIARPRNICVHVVTRLANEYQKRIAKATGYIIDALDGEDDGEGETEWLTLRFIKRV